MLHHFSLSRRHLADPSHHLVSRRTLSAICNVATSSFCLILPSSNASGCQRDVGSLSHTHTHMHCSLHNHSLARSLFLTLALSLFRRRRNQLQKFDTLLEQKMRWQCLPQNFVCVCVCVCACICISVFDFCRSWRIFNLTCSLPPPPPFQHVTMKSINLLQCLNPIYHFANFSRSFSLYVFFFRPDSMEYVDVCGRVSCVSHPVPPTSISHL